MPNIRHIISSFPQNELKEVASRYNPKKIHLYVDFKNAATGLFVNDIAEEIALNYQNNGYDSSIFQSILLYASKWKRWADKNNYEIDIFFCCDSGKSVYHNAINNKYKEARAIRRTTMPWFYDKIPEIVRKNVELAKSVVGKLPNVYFISLDYLESDFVSYYLITRKFNDLGKDVLHIISSSDKDMFQTVALPDKNIFMFYKRGDSYYVIEKESIMVKYADIKKLTEKSKAEYMKIIKNVPPIWISAIMAPVGDVSDSVIGIDKIGPKNALKIFSNIELRNKLIGSFEELVERVSAGGKFIKEESISNFNNLDDNWKKLVTNNDLVTDAFKLINYELLCKWMEKKDKTDKIEYINEIDKSLNKNEDEILKNPSVLMESMSSLEDCVLREFDLNGIFSIEDEPEEEFFRYDVDDIPF